MSEQPIDLIRLEGVGSSVVLRISGGSGGGAGQGTAVSGELEAEFVVETPLLRGSIRTAVSARDLREWQEALDVLDTGDGISWREGSEEPAMFIERDDVDEDRARVTIRDTAEFPSSVSVNVWLGDAWFDDAYDRLDLVWKTWPPAAD